MSRILGALVLGVALWARPADAVSYDPLDAGHPLRVVGYALHPVGVVLDFLLFRPAWYLGTHEPLRTLFGVRVWPVDQPAEPGPAVEPSS